MKTREEIPAWPLDKPIYDISRSYLENAEEGPFFTAPIPLRAVPPQNEWVDFLGFRVASPLGVPAGPLLNARWTTLAGKLGFDIVTYKTIRSRAHPAHPPPNMVYVKTDRFLQPSEEGGELQMTRALPQNHDTLALTNSFGIPSRDEAYLQDDIARALSTLAPYQVLIVSVVGTPRSGEDFVEDFVVAAQIAVSAGAKIIEADFSCPNVLTCEGSIHTNAEAVFKITSRMKKAFPTVPLIIKVGVITEESVLSKVLVGAARAGAAAVCGINTLSMKVVDEHGQSALGEGRLRSGVCGGPIRLAALDFIEKARRVIDKEKLPLVLMATGGVTQYPHFDLFFKQGADVALSATGMMWDPYLALRYHKQGEEIWKRK